MDRSCRTRVATGRERPGELTHPLEWEKNQILESSRQKTTDLP